MKGLKLKTGALCLEFANTADWHGSAHPQEKLRTYRDLVLWAQRIRLLTEQDTEKLLAEAERHPIDAQTALERVIVLREAVYRIFSAIAHHRPPKISDLALLNELLSRALAQLQLKPTPEGFGWAWVERAEALDWMLWPIVRSTADLLTSSDLSRVKECADDRGCGWLFVDMSKNRSRRWCDMESCGNVAKARRHYQRKRVKQAPR